MKQLTEVDRVQALDYVASEPEVNIFVIGDIENFGVNNDTVSIHVNETASGWDSLVLRFFDNYVVYSRSAVYNAAAVASFLKTRTVGMISGKADIVARLIEFFPERQLCTTIMTKCSSVKSDYTPPSGIDIRKLTPDDAVSIVDLMTQIKEFRETYEDREAALQMLRTTLGCGGTGCGAFLDGMLVSCAQTTAENSMSAMVIGVATHPDVRGRGYASAVVSKLCSESFNAGKKFLCLFYDNPEAGRIYNRIGFEPFGEYALFR